MTAARRANVVWRVTPLAVESFTLEPSCGKDKSLT